MSKPILAIITQSIRMDNHLPLKYFKEFEVRHFYFEAPYGDLTENDLKNAIKCSDFRDLEQKIIDLNPDLIQGSEPYASRTSLIIARLTMKVAKKLGKPYFFPMLENRPAKARFGLVLGLVMQNVLRQYTKNASLVFYLNEGAKRNLETVEADPKKIKKELYGIWGVDTTLFRSSYSNQLNRKYIMYVGRFIEDKGIAYLTAAWNSIKAQFPDTDLVFIGSGEMAKDIKGTQVQNLGQKKNSELPAYFANALFTVYPSITMPRWEEQVGTVNLQSLACGTPVVTTTSGAIPEYVTDEVGVLVPERDAVALSEAISELLTDTEKREKLARNARPYILEKYDAEKNVLKIEKELIELIRPIEKS